MKLYRSTIDSTRWYAFSSTTGWMTFPAQVAGWQRRRHVRGVNRLVMREVPLRMGFNTGIPGAPMSEGSELRLKIAA
jgi:hypothetical protein